MQPPPASPFRTYLGLWKKHPGTSLVGLARYYLPWSASLKPGKTPIGDRRIWIVFAAKALLDRELTPSMRVFEFGMGGSTLYFLSRGCSVVSVEHNSEWYKTVNRTIHEQGYGSRWEGILREADDKCFEPAPGDNVSYASESGEYAGRTFHAYATAIDAYPDGGLDVVLIDGRARPACLLRAKSKVRPGGWLMLDNSERARYQAACATLDPEHWRKREFFGPGPYVAHEFWRTTAWLRA